MRMTGGRAPPHQNPTCSAAIGLRTELRPPLECAALQAVEFQVASAPGKHKSNPYAKVRLSS
jgi:hypothetical protein